MATRGNPNAIALGPGYLFLGPLGTLEPDDLITPWEQVDPGWVAAGYTSAGSEFDYQLSTSPVKVAEELDPLFNAPDGRTATLTFDLAQLTASNLQAASNGGTVETGAGIVIFEPPDLGQEVHCMLGFQSEDMTERWIYRQCLQTGQMKIDRKPGAANATIACVFSLERPATGAKLYRAILAAPLRS